MIGVLVFILGCLSIILFFIHINQKWRMVYIALKYFGLYLLAVYVMNLLFLPDFDYLKVLYSFWPGISITFGIYELITFYQDKRKIPSAVFFITFGGIYQYMNYQTTLLDKSADRAMTIFGFTVLSFWPIFVIGALAMIILIWRNK